MTTIPLVMHFQLMNSLIMLSLKIINDHVIYIDEFEFAQLIDQYARSQDINVYSIVAHSQGGMAALHLLTLS